MIDESRDKTHYAKSGNDIAYYHSSSGLWIVGKYDHSQSTWYSEVTNFPAKILSGWKNITEQEFKERLEDIKLIQELMK